MVEPSGSMMTCQMPAVVLLDEFTEELEQSRSGKIDDSGGFGVAIYRSPDGQSRVDIYLGLILDGFKRYTNISSIDPSIKMQFAIQPRIRCHTDTITFSSNRDDSITIQVLVLFTRVLRYYFASLINT